MSNSINSNNGVALSHTQPKQNTHTARNVLGFTGLAVGSACVADSFEKSFGKSVREAVQSYKDNADVVRNAFTKKDYVNKFMKDAKTKSAVIGAGTAIVATATGLAVGTLLDAIANRTKSNK